MDRCRVSQKQLPTDWLERLPPSMLVDILRSRSRVLGGLATSLGKRDKPLSSEEIVQLEKRPRRF